MFGPGRRVAPIPLLLFALGVHVLSLWFKLLTLKSAIFSMSQKRHNLSRLWIDWSLRFCHKRLVSLQE
jgi:hypothetical protein